MKRSDELTTAPPLTLCCNFGHLDERTNVFAFAGRRDEPSDVPFADVSDGYLFRFFFLFSAFQSCFGGQTQAHCTEQLNLFVHFPSYCSEFLLAAAAVVLQWCCSSAAARNVEKAEQRWGKAEELKRERRKKEPREKVPLLLPLAKSKSRSAVQQQQR